MAITRKAYCTHEITLYTLEEKIKGAVLHGSMEKASFQSTPCPIDEKSTNVHAFRSALHHGPLSLLCARYAWVYRGK